LLHLVGDLFELQITEFLLNFLDNSLLAVYRRAPSGVNSISMRVSCRDGGPFWRTDWQRQTTKICL